MTANTKNNFKILIVVEEGKHFIYYKSVAEELLCRGYNVSMFFAKRSEEECILLPITQFKQRYQKFEFGKAFSPVSFLNTVLVKRRFATYRHLLLPRERPRFFSDRVIIYLPFFLRFAARHNLFYINSFIKSGIFGKWLGYVEEKIPPDKNIIAQVRSVGPDVLLAATGDLSSTSPESNYLKAAKVLGIPCALSVMSWDNLQTKGAIQIIPDVLLVWNEMQVEEATKYHQVPRDIIRITGAFFFDQWFLTHKPSRREEFCTRYGLDPGKPILTYLSSSGIFGDEIEYLRKIYKAIEGLDIQLVVRPYPVNGKKLYNKRRHKFYNSPESAGVTLIDEYYNDIQSKSPHFKHLISSGALNITKDVGGLRNIIKDLQTSKDGLESKRREFIGQYLRPRGIQISAAKCLADELEKVTGNRK